MMVHLALDVNLCDSGVLSVSALENAINFSKTCKSPISLGILPSIKLPEHVNSIKFESASTLADVEPEITSSDNRHPWKIMILKCE